MRLSSEQVKQVYNLVKKKYEQANPNDMSRFKHVEGVCEMATFLAKKYKVDVSKAQICALVHDYYKYEDVKEMAKFLSDEEIEECEKCKVLYHSYASSKQLKILFGIDDKEMESAIKNHVFGHTNMTRLEEIILISDYTEKNRKYPDCIRCREILLQGKLVEAIYYSTEATIKHLVNQNIKPHKMQYEVLDEYGRKMSMEKLKTVLEALKKVNAVDIVCYNTNEKSPFFNYVVVASVDSIRQLNACLDYVKDDLAEKGFIVKNSTGANSEWVIVDACDLLVHVFYKEERERFAIDKLYMDSPIEKVEA